METFNIIGQVLWLFFLIGLVGVVIYLIALIREAIQNLKTTNKILEDVEKPLSSVMEDFANSTHHINNLVQNTADKFTNLARTVKVINLITVIKRAIDAFIPPTKKKKKEKGGETNA